MKTRVVFILAGFLAGFTTAGSSSAPPAENPDPKLVVANNRFAFKLLQQVAKAREGKNVFIAPASISAALAMTLNGAAGETEKAMLKTLELEGLSLAEINLGNLRLRKALETLDPQVELAIANSLWGRKEVVFKPDFLQRNQVYYGDEIAALDFGSAQAVPTIACSGQRTSVFERWRSRPGPWKRSSARSKPDRFRFCLH